MSRPLRAVTIAATAALLLASCGSSEPEAAPAGGTAAEESPAQSDGDEEKSSGEIQAEHAEENPEGEPMGTFSLTEEPLFVSTSTGASITMTMDAQPDADEQIAWLEQYREDVGGDPVTYILSEVDNRDGTERINMYSVSIFDTEGTEYTCEQPGDYLEANWLPVWLYGSTDVDEYESADGEPMDYDEATELEDRYRNYELTSDVEPLGQNTMVTICPADLPAEVTGVHVMPGGVYIDPTYATPISYEGEDG